MKFLANGFVYIFKRWGMWLVGIGVFAFLLLLVHRKVYECYAQDERYQLNLELLEVRANPDWLVGTELEPAVQSSIKMSGQTNIFDKDLIARTRQHYEQNPWVAQVHSIQKLFPNELVVKLELRKPIVAVEMKRTKNRAYYYLVDNQSVRLPGEYAKVPELPLTLPVIIGVIKPPPPAGNRWQDQGLNDALAVAQTLDEYQVYGKIDVAQIDVANSGGRKNKKESEVVIWTRDKIAIQWGRSPASEGFGEIPVAEKIKNLNYVLGIAPQLRGIKYVKIQFHQPCIALSDPEKKK